MVELATTGGGDINAATDTDSEGGGDTTEGRQSQRERRDACLTRVFPPASHLARLAWQ